MFDLIYASSFFKVPKITRAFFGPKLYRFHGSANIHAFNYQPSPIESITNTFLSYQSSIFWIAKYYMLYKSILFTFSKAAYTSAGTNDLLENAVRNILPYELDSMIRLSKFFVGSMFLAWILRGLARFQNSDYMNFIEILVSRQKSEVSKYDFDMKYWPIDYTAGTAKNEQAVFLPPVKNPKKMFNPVYDFLCTGVGRWLIMPGSLGFINSQVALPLQQNRAAILEKHKNNAKRLKIKLSSTDFIDALYVKGSARSEKIVICSEGNAGFYEVGIISAPLQQGYSVFGWNRPGFGQSYGDCNIDNERIAIQTILEYVIHELQYEPENIIVYGWSIA